MAPAPYPDFLGPEELARIKADALRALPVKAREAVADFDLEDPDFPEVLDDNLLSEAGYPYDRKMKRKTHDARLHDLQVELVKWQQHIKATGQRVVVVFEGRDSAGKGSTIKRFGANLPPREVRTVALPKPTDREQGEWYFQRYAAQLPTAGEIVLFDRSWYNRAGVEPVMGFCTPEQHASFLEEAPHFEHTLQRSGIHLIKFWLNIGRITQLRRFHDRRHNPLKIWKLSPIDLKALGKFDAYTQARNLMLDKTHTPFAPWNVVRYNDKRRGRLEVIAHVLRQFHYEGRDDAVVSEPDHAIIGLERHGLGLA